MPVTPRLDVADDTGTTRRRAGVRVPSWFYRLLRLLVHVVSRAYWRVEVDGDEHVPPTGPVILAPVHRSFMDFLVVSEVTKRKIFYMTKEEMWKSPLLGAVLDSVGAFPVHRDGADRLALERAQDVLERGDVLILFPEGTRRAGPVVEDLHEGAAFLAARTGAAIVPIGIGGTAEAMPKGSKFVRPVKVHIVVGPALAAPERSARGRVPRAQVHALTEELCSELQRLYDDAERRAKPPDRPAR
ncbi:MAG TPA: lysophospholipid acyltransferase family protein [Acidimicrobiales bacterium]|nr:lysophospholipid acyltransferase family protein [Acidimicrobiales bacterium]